MAGLFEGIPTSSPTGSVSSTETPKWFQDLTYQQMMAAKSVADMPYSQYTLPRVAQATPDQNAAYGATRMNVGAWQPWMGTALSGTSGLTGPLAGFQQGSGMISEAGGMNALPGATSYLNNASQNSVAGIENYMNPYMDQVTNRISELGARNLSENLLPAISDSFIRAGQFGGSRMGEFGARALRDTQDSILAQQAQALQSGYSEALGASSADKARNLQIGSTYGDIYGADASRLLSSGQALANVAGSEGVRQQGALQQMADLSQQQQGLHTQDAAALQAIGQEQQAQQQRELDSAYSSWAEQNNYPKTQLDWLQAQLKGTGQYIPTTTTSSGYTTQFAPSPLSQLASGYFAVRGLTQ